MDQGQERQCAIGARVIDGHCRTRADRGHAVGDPFAQLAAFRGGKRGTGPTDQG
jgi:hypothetical protein